MLTLASVLYKARERSLLNPCETLAFSFVLHSTLYIHCEQQSNKTTAYVLELHLVFMLPKFHDHDGYETLFRRLLSLLSVFMSCPALRPIGAHTSFSVSRKSAGFGFIHAFGLCTVRFHLYPDVPGGFFFMGVILITVGRYSVFDLLHIVGEMFG